MATDSSLSMKLIAGVQLQLIVLAASAGSVFCTAAFLSLTRSLAHLIPDVAVTACLILSYVLGFALFAISLWWAVPRCLRAGGALAVTLGVALGLFLCVLGFALAIQFKPGSRFVFGSSFLIGLANVLLLVALGLRAAVRELRKVEM